MRVIRSLTLRHREGSCGGDGGGVGDLQEWGEDQSVWVLVLFPVTNLGSLYLLLNFISLSVHTMRAVVLKPLVGVVTQSATTRLLGGALSVDRHRCHSRGWLWRRACCNGRRRGWCCSPKLVWGIGGGQHPTHCSLAQQTTTGQSAGYRPTLTCYKATTSPPSCVLLSLHTTLLSLSLSLSLQLCIKFDNEGQNKWVGHTLMKATYQHLAMKHLTRNLSKSSDCVSWPSDQQNSDLDATLQVT